MPAMRDSALERAGRNVKTEGREGTAPRGGEKKETAVTYQRKSEKRIHGRECTIYNSSNSEMLVSALRCLHVCNAKELLAAFL